jgi:guanylate cyclase
MNGLRTGAISVVQRLANIGADPADSEDVRVQKGTLVLASSTVTVLAIFYVATYLSLGLLLAAAIPLGYQLVTIATLAIFARTRDFRLLRASQLLLMLILPFLLQWILGGYAASSAVSLWATVAVFGAMFFYSAERAVPWFLGFLVLTAVSGLLDPRLSQAPADIPESIQTIFFVLNVGGVTVTAFFLLQYAVRARDAEHARSESLLLNVLPRSIAQRLKREPGVIAERFEDVTVLFADVVDFTPFAEQAGPVRVVGVLDEVFTVFDELTQRHGLEKIKTIGDAYMVVGGVPELRPDHAEAVAALALEMHEELARACLRAGVNLDIRVGIDSGPVVAGVIGRHKFIYDLWGDTVNTASRMESSGVPGRIQVTERTYARLKDLYHFEDRGEVDVKGKGRLRTYLLVGQNGTAPRQGGGRFVDEAVEAELPEA